MNIFYLDKCPVKAAKYQYNKHVVKMILESAQMLCTSHHVLDNRVRDLSDIPYKIAHINHPCTIWVRKSSDNYMWLFNHFIALSKEYTKRYGKNHLSYQKCAFPLAKVPIKMPVEGFTQPPQAMPDEYKDECSIQAYWNYYIGDKHHIAHESETIYKYRPNG